MLIRYYILYLLLISIHSLMAQDTHYWTNQYGTRSAPMGGAVVAGAPDNSTVMYNQAGPGFISEASVSVNTNVYRIENIRIQNALGQEADFAAVILAPYPYSLEACSKRLMSGGR